MLNLKRFTCLALVSMTGASLHILDGSPAWAGDQLNAPPGSFVQSTNSNPNQALNLSPNQAQAQNQNQIQNQNQVQNQAPRRAKILYRILQDFSPNVYLEGLRR